MLYTTSLPWHLNCLSMRKPKQVPTSTPLCIQMACEYMYVHVLICIYWYIFMAV